MIDGSNRLVTNPEEIPKIIFNIAYDRYSVAIART